jgi:hypothetical protein
LLGIISNTKGIEGKEGKENAKFGRMEKVLAKAKIDNNYTLGVLLSTRLFAQHFSLFGHMIESLEGCLGFFNYILAN